MRIAIVGCGWAGARHAQAFVAAGAHIAWAVDVDPERAQAIHAEQASADLHQALADPTVSAVSVCLPHHLHAEATLAATQAGKHVLVEKPIAATLEDADRMIAAARAGRLVLMVAETVRFDPLLVRAAELVHAGAIGQPALVQVTREAYLRDAFLRGRRWFLDAQQAAGGIMMSGGIHDFELLRMLLGEPSSVYAVRVRQRFAEMQGDDTSIALVQFPNGAAATLVESFLMKSLPTAAGAEVHTLRVDGDLGSLSLNTYHQSIRMFSEARDRVSADPLTSLEIRVAPADAFQREVSHFLECVSRGVEPLTDGRSQRRNLELVLAAYASITRGQPIHV